VTTATPRRTRRATALVGVLLLVAGLGLAAYLAWEYWGTTWVSERRHSAVIDDLEQGWSSGETVAEVSAGEATAIVRIPAFGDDYAVPLLEGSSDEVLASGFGHLADTAEPGADGNFVLAGHRVTHGEPLRDMPSLEPGDTVVVETATRRLTYVLDTTGDGLEVDLDADWVLAPEPVNPDPDGVQPPTDPALLTLVTCADLFHSDQRLVAFGHLVSDAPRVS
jgi:sortase A